MAESCSRRYEQVTLPSLPFFRTMPTGMFCSSFLAPERPNSFKRLTELRIVRECWLKVMMPYLGASCYLIYTLFYCYIYMDSCR